MAAAGEQFEGAKGSCLWRRWRSPSHGLANCGRKRSLAAAAAPNERRAVAGAGGGKGGANSELHAGGSETQWREELARALVAGVLPGGARRT